MPISVDVYNNTSLLSNSIPGQTVCGNECYSPPCQDPWGGQREDAWSFASEKKSNQIKSLLLSHHHSTCALVSEILESVLQTVQNNLQIDSTYLQTYTEDNVQNAHSYSQYKQCTIKTCLQLSIHIIHSMYTLYIMYTYTQ